jgi:hypothetical protein
MTNPQKTSPKFLSFNWLRGVADDKRISILHRFILERICLHRHNDGGKCNPGYSAVATELGVYRTTVIRAVEVGVRCGWLAPPTRARRENASFVFLFPTEQQEVASKSDFKTQSRSRSQEQLQDDQEVALKQSRSRSRRVKKSLGKRASRAKPNASTHNGGLNGKENGGRKSPEPPDQVGKKKETSGEAFDRFWVVYPKRVTKEAARKAFAKAVENGTDAEALIAGAQRYAVERQGQDPKYTKHPATWLNGGCWEDEAPGAPVIDEHGNVVAFEQEQRAQPSSRRSPLEIYEEWLEENPSLRW